MCGRGIVGAGVGVKVGNRVCHHTADRAPF